jgi:hypothetical protein
MQSLFKYHQLNPGGVAKAEAVGLAFDALLSKIETHCNPNSREFSITKTKLEEACFFAKKSIAVDPANQLNPE